MAHYPMQHPTKSYWLDSGVKVDVAESNEQNSDKVWDVAVVGGGLSGMSMAWWLKEFGVSDVCVLEARECGGGASGRNGGHMFPSVAASGYVAEKYGPGPAGDLFSFEQDSVERTKAILPEEALIGKEARTLLKFDEEVEIYENERSFTPCPTPDVATPNDLPKPFKHVLSTTAYSLHPSILQNALVKHTCPVIVRDCVESLKQGEDGVWIVGKVKATRVVLATNGYSKGVLPDVNIKPVRGQCIAVADMHIPCNFTWDDGDVYVARTVEGCVIGGMRPVGENDGTNISDDTVLDPKVSSGLRRALSDLKTLAPPGTGTVPRITHEWTGVMGFTPDMLPLVGEIPGHPLAYIIAGFSGEGVPKIFGSARLLAAMVVGQPERTPEAWVSNTVKILDPERF